MEAVTVLLDFDGTATPQDVGGSLLGHFARDDSWRVIDNDYVNGRIGSRVAYRLLERVLDGDPGAWERWALATAELDPGLPGLTDLCRQNGWELEILSDGLDFYIRAMLDRAGLDLPFRASRVLPAAPASRIRTPYMNPLCGRCGTCKADRVTALAVAGRRVIYVGDGYSDLCAGPRAHRLFATGVLAEHCRARSIAHERFDRLEDVTRALHTDPP
jgi:HAD superfamily phosphoserine phosphatase-like hydrolase